MANNAILKAAIQNAIKTNGNNEITGQLLQQSLLSIIDAFGVGYQFIGVATLSTNPGTPDQNVFYIAFDPGTYSNFASLVVNDNELAFLKYNGTWQKDVIGVATYEQLLELKREIIGIPEMLKGISQPFNVRNGSQGNIYNEWVITLYGKDTSAIPVTPGHKYAVKINKAPENGYQYYFRIITYSTSSPANLSSNTVRNETDNWNSYHLNGQPFEINDGEYGISIQVTELTSPGAAQASGTCIALRDNTFTIDELEFRDVTDAVPIEEAVEQILGIESVWGLKYDLMPPTRNGSRGNAGNAYAVVWLNIPCAGYDSIQFRIKKPFASTGNVYVFAYTLPDGSYRDAAADDIQNGFYQSEESQFLTLSTKGLSEFTIQAYETALPFSYPSSCTPLRVAGFASGDGLEFLLQKETGEIKEIKEDVEQLKKNSWYSKFVGKGTTFSDSYIYGLAPNRTYRIVFPELNWDNVSGVAGNKFAISNWYNNAYQTLVSVSLPREIEPYYDFTLPGNTDYVAIGGRANTGVEIPYYIFDVTETAALRQNMEIRSEQKTPNCGTQGLTIVGDKIVQFNPASDDHTASNSLLIWNLQYQELTQMVHNLGHAASADYCAESDSLAVANGTSDTTIKPRLDIITNAASKIVPGSTLSYSDQDIIHIELSTSVKEIGGTGLVCTFGGNWRIVYLATGQDKPRKIFRCILGVGAEDLSDPTGSDVTRWGTFIPGKNDNEYNGTLKVLSTYTGEETDVYQGICYRNGFIYMACGYTEPLVHKIQLYSNGTYKIIQTNMPIEYNVDGTEKSVEPEGLCFVDSGHLLLGLPNYGGLFTIESF